MSRSIKDSGWNRLIKEMMKDHSITVGVHEKDANRDEGSQTNAEIGYRHEYGAGVPRRSFLRSTMDDNENTFRRYVRRGFEKVARGELLLDAFMEQMGLYMKGRVIRKINSNIPPELADSTVARKGSTTALIDTGDLKQSINYEVQ